MRHASLGGALVVLAPALFAAGAIATPQVEQIAPDLLASDQGAGAQLGSDVALRGDRAVVGAWGDPSGSFRGAVYVFERAAGGTFAQTAKLVDPSGLNGDVLGRCVALDEDTIVATATGYSSFAGTALVWRGGGSTWNLEAQLLPDVAQANDLFGVRAAIDGDTIVVGAPSRLASQGSAFVFVRDTGGSWQQQARLDSSGGQPGDLFGIDVALRGDRALVGACSTGNDVGTAYLFRRTGTTWTQVQAIARPTPATGDLFGISVALDEEANAVIGGSQRGGGGPRVGFLDVFGRSGDALLFEQELGPPAPTLFNTGFGLRCSSSAGAIAASQGSFGGTVGRGLVFERIGGAFAAPLIVSAATTSGGDEFSGGLNIPGVGGSDTLLNGGIALDGAELLVGSRGEDLVLANSGAAHLFRLPFLHPTFCRAPTFDPNGCGACPCGNAPAGPPSPGGCLNSAGRSARLAVSGRNGVVGDTLRIEVVGATGTSFGVLLSGLNLLPVGNPICPAGGGVQSFFLDGLRCIGGATLRHGARASDANGDIGATNNGWGPPSGPTGGLIAAAGLAAGESRAFQVFYRENPALGCLSGQNTTDAVLVTAVP